MDSINATHKVSCWKSKNEFAEIRNLIFDEKSTINDKVKALNVLKVWKIHRRQDIGLGILCTIILLDISIKDSSNAIKDTSALTTLYASALTKFINYATSFKLGTNTMYGSAIKLGIDSFIIDLRHNFSHGRQNFNIEVYRNSHRICMQWIKDYYWDKEIDNIQDANIRDIQFNKELEEKLHEIFSFYDILSNLILKNYKTFDEWQNSGEFKELSAPVDHFMKEKNLKNFRQSFKYLTNSLAKIIESKEMRLNPKTFFHIMLNKCELFMEASMMSKDCFIQEEEYSDDEEVEIKPTKRPKKSTNQSIVNLYQPLIFLIAKNDYLKILLDNLMQICLNPGEIDVRRETARFWIEIILKSYDYYQKYYEFSKSDIMDPKIPPKIRNIYSYQLDADLRNVFIFVGTQMHPSSLKYSHESALHLLEAMDANENDLNIGLNLIPLIYPPLTCDQIDDIKTLINIKSNSSKKIGKCKDGKIYTLEDLHPQMEKILNDSNRDMIWKYCEKEIYWNSLSIGHEFTV